MNDCEFEHIERGMTCTELFELHTRNAVHNDECNKKNKQLRKHQ